MIHLPHLPFHPLLLARLSLGPLTYSCHSS
jgi:hypothetical protein